MSGTLPGARHCVRHQSNTSHYAPHNCEQCCLLAALRGMVSIHDSVTMGQEREFKAEWLPKARAAIAKAEGRA